MYELSLRGFFDFNQVLQMLLPAVFKFVINSATVPRNHCPHKLK